MVLNDAPDGYFLLSIFFGVKFSFADRIGDIVIEPAKLLIQRNKMLAPWKGFRALLLVVFLVMLSHGNMHL